MKYKCSKCGKLCDSDVNGWFADEPSPDGRFTVCCRDCVEEVFANWSDDETDEL